MQSSRLYQIDSARSVIMYLLARQTECASDATRTSSAGQASFAPECGRAHLQVRVKGQAASLMFCAAGNPKLVQLCLDSPSPLQLCFLCARGVFHACSGVGVETDWADNLCNQPMSSLRCTLGLGPVRSDSSAFSVHGDSSYPEWGAPYQLILLLKRYYLQLLLVLSSKLSTVERMSPQQLICYVHVSPALELLILHAQEKTHVLAQRLTWQERKSGALWHP